MRCRDEEPETSRATRPTDGINHWFVVIVFILLAASGLAFFHPAFYSSCLSARRRDRGRASCIRSSAC